MKGYPKWFSPNRKPYRPSEPQKTYKVFKEAKYIDDGYVITQEDVGSFLRVEKDEYEFYIDITLCSRVERENEEYKSQYKRYLKKLAAYEEKTKEWKVLKKRYDEQKKLAKEKLERNTLEKLLNKYGSPVKQ